MQKIVVDSSVVVDGRITKLIEEGKIEKTKIVVPEPVVAELEFQANQGRETGHSGLQELQALRRLADEGKIELEYTGERPSLEKIKLAPGGEIDAMIRDFARKLDATLLTSDKVQAEVARAYGIETIYLEPEKAVAKELSIMKFFTPDTMSLHLKEGVPPIAKRGKPGQVKFVKLRDQSCAADEIVGIAREIIEETRKASFKDSFIEIERKGATVIQLGDMRIAIARPPFSDGYEITAVRPVAKITLNDYTLSPKLKQRLKERAEGILVAGPPGGGKTTFSSALAEFYKEKGCIIKTMEQPRDLMVSDEVTQYRALEGSMEKTAEILLLVRPDYTIFDEMRKTSDFQVYADMRLAGIGMVGVVHCAEAIDAVQRLIGRVELGMIPSIVDTIIFIKDGGVGKVYEIVQSVRVPTGMYEEDLARPLIEVRDFETGKVEYEIYTFGEEVVVMPVGRARRVAAPVTKLAADRVLQEIRKYTRDAHVEIEMPSESRAIIWADDRTIPRILGKRGKTIEKIEDSLGISIDVRAFEERGPKIKPEVPAELQRTDKHIIFSLGEGMAGKSVEVYVEDEYLFTATAGRAGDVRISKKSNIAERLLTAIDVGEKIKIVSAE
ncbi:MAG: PINc/VapC family ATPase [Euryarchaeota archaeon]|nr:PINc/VapC family ATPase [Euryarchaeota archaeon]